MTIPDPTPLIREAATCILQTPCPTAQRDTLHRAADRLIRTLGDTGTPVAINAHADPDDAVNRLDRIFHDLCAMGAYQPAHAVNDALAALTLTRIDNPGIPTDLTGANQ